MTEAFATIGVIGAGRLGSSLALALQRAGHPIAAVCSRQATDAAALCAQLGAAVVASEAQIAADCELLFLSVPDASVTELAARLRVRAGQAVVHCSGALPLAALDAAARGGAWRGCLHPLQSFPERFADPARFAGISCGVEGDGALLPRLQAYCKSLGARVLDLRGIDRAGYHAAAVFASNYLVALHAAAAQAWTAAGLPAQDARAALAPLTLGTAQQIARLPLERALTGPLARGDAPTIAGHLHALRAAPALHDLYRQLASALLQLPIAISPAQRALVEAMLAGGEPEDG